tara:strand:+ start:1474 stop:2046 length:573 start_codon:yes stop_codon:yes gene_type:complete
MKDLKKTLEEIYQTSPYLQFKNKTHFNKKKVGKSTYGEITQIGTNNIVEKFKDYFNTNTVFYDLGSGLGKMVIHIGVEYGVKKSIGIEYSKERYEGALFLKESFAKEHNNIEFHCGNYILHDLSDATVIYLDNTCFPDEIFLRMYEGLTKGCLILYKKTIRKGLIPNQNIIKDLAVRTYKQNDLMWTIKK